MKNDDRTRPRRTNAEMSAETQSRIIAATIASLAELGFAGTTISGIAKRVGVSRAALIYHYDSKYTLMAATIDAIYDELAAIYQAAAHPSLTGQERLVAILDASYRFTTTVSQMAQIELLLAARRDPVFLAEVGPTIKARDSIFDQLWHEITSDWEGNRDRLDLFRDFAVSVFRGITINRSLDLETKSFDRQLVLLRNLLLGSISATPG